MLLLLLSTARPLCYAALVVYLLVAEVRLL